MKAVLAWAFLGWVGLWTSCALAGLRLVSTSPQLTELLFQLGRGPDLVAVSAGSAYPAEAARLPTLGPLFFPGVEGTLRLAPDWVLVDDFNRSAPYERGLSVAGIRWKSVRIDTVKALFAESRAIMREIYGEPSPPIVDRWETCLGTVRPAGPAFSFLVVAWWNPVIALGVRTPLSELLTFVGGRNLVPAGLQRGYPQLPPDWLAAHRPDRVYVLSARVSEEALARFRIWWGKRLPEIVSLDPDTFSRATFTLLAELGRLGGTWGTSACPY